MNTARRSRSVAGERSATIDVLKMTSSSVTTWRDRTLLRLRGHRPGDSGSPKRRSRSRASPKIRGGTLSNNCGNRRCSVPPTGWGPPVISPEQATEEPARYRRPAPDPHVGFMRDVLSSKFAQLWSLEWKESTTPYAATPFAATADRPSKLGPDHLTCHRDAGGSFCDVVGEGRSDRGGGRRADLPEDQLRPRPRTTKRRRTRSGSRFPNRRNP